MKMRCPSSNKSLFLAALYGFLTITAGTAPASAQFVDFAGKEGGSISVAGFPALEVMPGNDADTAMIVAREVLVQDNITYSSGYFSPTKKFTPPPFFSFTLYGYHNNPEWKDVKTVNFKFAGQTFSGQPLYTVQGPDRDRSLDTQKSEYFESMIVKLPPAVARQIANNKGVLVTTSPPMFHLPIPASKMDRFKQLVDSVSAIANNSTSRAQTKPKSAPQPKPFGGSGDGLPIEESYSAEGIKTYQTHPIITKSRVTFQATAGVSSNGHRPEHPLIFFTVGSVGENPVWQDAKSFTVIFEGRYINTAASKSTQVLDNGAVLTLLQARFPYAVFSRMSKAQKLCVRVSGSTFEIPGTQLRGLRALASGLK